MVKTLEKVSTRLLPIVSKYGSSNNRLILIDYDGTLVPFTQYPEQAKPSKQVLNVIEKLAADSHNTIIIISGRDRNTLDNWLGHLPIQLIAEHGAFEKHKGIWQSRVQSHARWKEAVLEIIRPYINTVLGSLIEEKDTAIAYHYRNAIDVESAELAVASLIKELEPLCEPLGIHITHSNMTLEIRQNGIDKGKTAINKLDQDKYDFILCAGDSETDEDMFNKLSHEAFCIKVGLGKTVAAYHIKTPSQFIDFLTELTNLYIY